MDLLSFIRCLCGAWKLLIGILAPFLFLPLLICIGTKEARCAFVIGIMATYWITEPIPMAATSLLPVGLFPLLGVISTAEASQPYMKDFLMLFVGGLMVAIAVESSNLHQRIALRLLLLIGTSARRLMLGFMIATGFLSMWISNVATTAMMVPILEAVLNELQLQDMIAGRVDQRKPSEISNGSISVTVCQKSADTAIELTNLNLQNSSTTIKQLDNKGSQSPINHVGSNVSIKNALFLSIAYAANIGGTGTLTGTGPNIVLKGVLEEYFPDYEALTFATWMFYNVPVMVLCIIIAWLCLQVTYIKCCECTSEEEVESIRKVISRRYDELGPMKFQEGAVLSLFVILVILWVFRDPQFMTGWSAFLYPGIKVSDASASISIALLMFLIPSDPKQLGKGPRLLDWRTVQTKMPWSVIILLGGGFSLAEGVKKSGLSNYITNNMMFLKSLPAESLMVTLLFVTAMLTEVFSNTAMATIFIPVMCQMAKAISIHPLYLSMPVAIACSFAFILPVATPPNAMVYERSRMRIIDMAKPGIFMNILCCCVELLMIHTLGPVIFNFKAFEMTKYGNTTTDLSNEILNSSSLIL